MVGHTETVRKTEMKGKMEPEEKREMEATDR